MADATGGSMAYHNEIEAKVVKIIDKFLDERPEHRARWLAVANMVNAELYPEYPVVQVKAAFRRVVANWPTSDDQEGLCTWLYMRPDQWLKKTRLEQES